MQYILVKLFDINCKEKVIKEPEREDKSLITAITKFSRHIKSKNGGQKPIG